MARRCLMTRLRRSRLSARVASASSDRWPSARGPNSKRPRQSATTLPAAMRTAAAALASGTGSAARPSARARSTAAPVSNGSPSAAVASGAGRGSPRSRDAEQGRAQRAARVAGCRRHEHPFEPGLARQAGVRQGVERHAPGQAEGGRAGPRARRAREAEQRLLGRHLERRRDVGAPRSSSLSSRSKGRPGGRRGPSSASSAGEKPTSRSVGVREESGFERERSRRPRAAAPGRARRGSAGGRRRRAPSPCTPPR